ncbi:helix-turn-helix transcriptional regulator [Buttiauxella izardii]|uniref:Helix-turn-helix transcriptional regulator n=1 Tax=Buttiauxella izardii TaxID=82991 RepID=A0A3A5JRB9_9ENTR|nr:LuxR C-terminal-related transcriptional regulator [Buttiauxella izardii]RJT21492.1 helix-turn-helix transcriptional regulator [Buttiauxella izardii]
MEITSDSALIPCRINANTLLFAQWKTELLYIAARKRRFRRIRNGGIDHPHARVIPIIFDRLESLQYKIRAEPAREPLDLILMTRDNFLSLALTEHFFKYQRTHVCATLDEAEKLLNRSPQPRMLIDLDGVNVAAIDVLNTIRQWQKTWPQLNVMQFTACRCMNVVMLIDAASDFPVVERRQRMPELHNALVQKQHVQRLVLTQKFAPAAPLSSREWNILLAVAKGESLKSIARSFGKPYHYVVYTLGRVAARVGLKNNKELIHLLNRLTCPLAGKE